MFQRTILRQGQTAARSAVSSRSMSTASLAVRRPSSLQSQLRKSFRPLIRQPACRFYSTEKAAESEGKKEEAKEGEAAAEQSPEDALRKELEEKKKEVTDLKDKYVRSVADFLNLQERTKRDMEQARNFAIQKFAMDLLESIDNFDRALLAVPADKLSGAEAEANKDLLDLVTGLQMTQSVLMNSLKRHGVDRFDPSEAGENGKPQKFDPNLHEATFMAKAENLEDGDIMYTQTKGFTLNGRTIRAAKVGVVRNS